MGLVVGTVPYMSPEQVKGQSVDARSDIFSLGVVLYELATGRRPFDGDTPAETISSILRDDPRRVTEARRDVPRHLERIIDHCLNKEPRERFQTARDILNQLRDLRKEVESAPLALSGRPSDQAGVTPAGSPAASLSSAPGSHSTSTGPGAAMKGGRSRAWLFVVGGAAVVVLVASSAFWMGTHRSNEAAPSGSAASAKTGGGESVPSKAIDSIAVLPFTVPSGDASNDFLGDGIAENVTNNLTTLPGLRVVPRSVAFRERGRDDELEAVARELGVRAILTGRVSRRGDRLIVGVELTDMAEMSQIWGDRFDTPMDEILAIESAIGSRIIDALRIQISGEDAERTIRRETDVPAAHLAYMEARHAWSRRSAAGFQAALELCDKAIAADPSFALAHASKAETYVLMMNYLGPPAGYALLLRREVDAALRLDPDLAQAYPVQGFALAMDMRWADADLAFRRAIELDPDHATAHHWLGVWSAAMGDLDGCLSQMEQARRLDPGSAIIATDLGNALRRLGRVEEAEKIYYEVLEAEPTFWRALEGLATIHWLAGRYEDAVRMYERSVEIGGEIAFNDGLLAMIYGRTGDMDRARQELRRMERRAASGSYVAPFGFARAYVGMGDMDRCFQWLERSLTERDPLLILGTARQFPEITTDPRWPAFEVRMNFPKKHG